MVRIKSDKVYVFYTQLSTVSDTAKTQKLRAAIIAYARVLYTVV